MTPTGTSGDLAADRRYQWAAGALRSRDYEAARDLFSQVLDLAPHWAPAWFGLGESLEALDRRAEAAAAFREALGRDPEDSAGAALRLARLAGESPAAAPRAYVKTLFDQYADRFDRHLTEVLGYRGPQILLDAVERAAPERAFAHMIDLGCGAGLAGEAFRARAKIMTGVDLAPAMIAKARAKNLYDGLAVADLLDFLVAEPAQSADLVIAADVFVYVGDLDPIFAAIARILESGGLFAFTTQSLAEGAGFHLGDDLRFAHSAAYLRACAARAQLGVESLSPAATRKDRGADTRGWAVVLAKP
jgi:predicted TPR repeat methyltransferase